MKEYTADAERNVLEYERLRLRAAEKNLSFKKHRQAVLKNWDIIKEKEIKIYTYIFKFIFSIKIKRRSFWYQIQCFVLVFQR